MTCVCGYLWPAERKLAWSVAAHVAHRAAHLAAFPNLDAISRKNLDQLVANAMTFEKRAEELLS